MKVRSIQSFVFLIFLIILPALACSFFSPRSEESNQTTSKQPGETEEQEEKPVSETPDVTGNEIEITQSTAYLDAFGVWNIHGLLRNTADYAVGLVEMEVRLADDALQETYLAAPFGLDPGKTIPFEIQLPQSVQNLDQFNLNIIRLQRANNEPAALEISPGKLYTDESGIVTLTGEIVNNTGSDAYLNSIQAALFGEDGKLITSASCQECPSSVCSGGKVPVQFLFFGHPADVAVDHFEIYPSSDQYPGCAGFDISLVEPAHAYMDEGGWFHVLGEIQNDTEDILDLALLGTFYDQNGAVLGAASTRPSVRSLNPGERSPYELKFLTPADAVANWQIQIDAAASREVETPSVNLTARSVQETATEFDWVITGSVVNDSSETIQTILVVVGLRDAQTGELVGLTHDLFQDEFAPGSSTEFTIMITPDLSLDPAGLEYFTIVRGR